MNVSDAQYGLTGLLDFAVTADAATSGAVIDSRAVKQGDIFFAIKGENTDGNRYAANASLAGASLVVMDNAEEYAKVTGNKALVEDTVAALKSFGLYRLSRTKGKRVAVTGSFGKTSTKELMLLAYAESGSVYATPGNYNNDLGVAVTAAGADEDADILVFELGTNSAGEIAALSAYVRPEVAVVTGVGHAHVGRFGSVAAVAVEKMSIADGLVAGGVVIAHEDVLAYPEAVAGKPVQIFGTSDKADIRMTEITRTGTGVSFRLGNSVFVVNHIYDHFARNAALVASVGRLLGLSDAKTAAGLAKFAAPSGRGKIIEAEGLSIVDDCYNMSLEAAISAIRNVNATGIRPAYALIGEMAEIEGFEELLAEKLGSMAMECPAMTFLFSGPMYSGVRRLPNVQVAATREETRAMLDAVENGIILVKASRSRKFEEFVQYLVEKKGGARAV